MDSGVELNNDDQISRSDVDDAQNGAFVDYEKISCSKFRLMTLDDIG